ncbi:MAG: cytochrome c biogenesis protein CcsA [Chitinophagales bacterium]|nr:cytochrome c biogenesis protein CcsA [Chitinophagales bacterium]
MDIPYEGEHLLPGNIGQLSVYTAFVFSLIAAVAFFISSFTKSLSTGKSWNQIGKILFFIHGAAVISIVINLFIIIHNHYFEYYYAWSHSNWALPSKYLLACFWEGQEGSFLLWMFWNVVLGSVIIFTHRLNQSRVLSVFAVVQGFLSSMLLGLYTFGYKIGSTPFSLLRDQMVNAPIFHRADYMSFITDGNGLNPLLQNYWMVIHPPILFMGFASTLVPFSFALSALMKRDFSSWTKSVLPWALFSAAILGTGIMMGGAWAYESLTFGGYWAWDPVENASLVPWLIMIGGIHTTLVFNKTGRSLRATFIFYILTFILVLYSTFLTRSGILGNTSVHAFTDLGMSGQLVIYMATLSIPAIVLLAYYWKKIPTVMKDENIWSREFWIFIGSLLLLVSAFQITFTTSIPVWNKLFGTNWAPPPNAVEHYNKFQIPVAIVLVLLSSAALFLKFKISDRTLFNRRMLINLIISVPVTMFIAILEKLDLIAVICLLFAGVFGIVSNFYYIVTVLKGKLRLSGAAVGHFGFALMMVGILISSAKKNTISSNTMGIDFGKDFSAENQRTNMLLYKNSPVQMQEYTVTYVGDSASPPNNYYKVNYEVFDSSTGKLKDHFTLYPNAQINPKMGLIANPDTRHYWYKDLYTHVTSVPDKTKESSDKNEKKFQSHLISKSDTVFTANSYVILEKIERINHSDKITISDSDLAVTAQLTVKTLKGETYTAQPIFYIHESRASLIDDNIDDLGLTFRLNKIIPEENKIDLQVAEENPKKDFIVMTAIVFPFINVLWLGTMFTILGFVISLIRIWQKKRLKTTIADETATQISQKVLIK